MVVGSLIGIGVAEWNHDCLIVPLLLSATRGTVGMCVLGV